MMSFVTPHVILLICAIHEVMLFIVYSNINMLIHSFRYEAIHDPPNYPLCILHSMKQCNCRLPPVGEQEAQSQAGKASRFL